MRRRVDAARTAATAALPAAAALNLVGIGATPPVLVRRVADTGTWLDSGPDLALLDLVALGAWAALAWLTLTVGLTALGAVPGRTGALASATVRRVSPAVLRRAAESLLCVGLVTGAVGGTAAAASAAPTAPLEAAETTGASGAILDTDWPVAHPPGAPPEQRPAPPSLPDGPVTAPPPRAAEPLDVVVVHRGDSLWRIVERHLGADADPAAVAATWPRWHEANRDVIGPDPDLLLPGQRLRPPS